VRVERSLRRGIGYGGPDGGRSGVSAHRAATFRAAGVARGYVEQAKTLGRANMPATEGRGSKARLPWPRASGTERLLQGGVLVILTGSLALGLALEPSETGTGTHSALGLPRCGMLALTGHPCPTCGVTTSFVLAAHGRFHDALVNQPFGLICFLLVVAGMLVTVATLTTGRSWVPMLTVYGVAVPAAVLLTLALLSWAYKWMRT